MEKLSFLRIFFVCSHFISFFGIFFAKSPAYPHFETIHTTLNFTSGNYSLNWSNGNKNFVTYVNKEVVWNYFRILQRKAFPLTSLRFFPFCFSSSLSSSFPFPTLFALLSSSLYSSSFLIFCFFRSLPSPSFPFDLFFFSSLLFFSSALVNPFLSPFEKGYFYILSLDYVTYIGSKSLDLNNYPISIAEDLNSAFLLAEMKAELSVSLVRKLFFKKISIITK